MEQQNELEITLFSFGFKYGVPTESNHIFDVRFLPNPYWVEGMRHKTGLEPDVADYVLRSQAGQEFTKNLTPLLDCLFHHNTLAKKEQITIGIGCTGGRHRSVALTEAMAKIIRVQFPELTVYHRDIKKDAEGASSQ